MLEKYKPILNQVFEYIHNRLVAGKEPDTIVDEVLERYPMELAYYDVSLEMKRELVYQLVAFGYFMYNGNSFITP